MPVGGHQAVDDPCRQGDGRHRQQDPDGAPEGSTGAQRPGDHRRSGACRAAGVHAPDPGFEVRPVQPVILRLDVPGGDEPDPATAAAGQPDHRRPAEGTPTVVQDHGKGTRVDSAGLTTDPRVRG